MPEKMMGHHTLFGSCVIKANMNRLTVGRFVDQQSVNMSAESVIRLRLLLHMIPLFQGNDDLPQWRGPAIKKKQPFSNARMLKIMHRRDVQCNTGE